MVDVTPEQIAAGLSRVQKMALTQGGTTRDVISTMTNLIKSDWPKTDSHDLTPLGTAVRKILEAGDELG